MWLSNAAMTTVAAYILLLTTLATTAFATETQYADVDACQVCEPIVDVVLNRLQTADVEAACSRVEAFPLHRQTNEASQPRISPGSCWTAVRKYKSLMMDAPQVCRSLIGCDVVAPSLRSPSFGQFTPDNETCVLCLAALDAIRHALPPNFSLKELMDTLDHACKQLEVEKVVNLCEFAVNIYGPELFNGLTGLIEPYRVCQYANLCPWEHALPPSDQG